MYNDIRLFIGGRQVEFSDPPQILYNYSVTDFTNPTVVKNGYSKTITVEGTPDNNDLFGHIWRLDRTTTENNFNPIRKAPFELFVNGEKYESGYVRLNNIKKTGNIIEYEITLFGGLGSLFFALSYAGEDTNRKLTLADLKYNMVWDGIESEPNLDFTINKDTVNTAWATLAENRSLIANTTWDVLNFAVTSEGIPSDFDAEKVLVNSRGTDFVKEKDGYKTFINDYVSNNGFFLGEANQELTMDNTFDLRSYLLRPVVKVYRVLQAIRNPDINGGFELDFDYHFFNSDNPYYVDGWMTLKNLRELDIEKQDETTITGATFTPNSNNKVYTLNYNKPAGSTPTGLHLETQMVFNPSTTTSVSNLYTYRKYENPTLGKALFGSKIKEQEVSSAVFIQAFAYNERREVVAQSKAYCCASYQFLAGPDKLKFQDYYNKKGQKVEFVSGKFHRVNGGYVFTDFNNNAINFSFDLDGMEFNTVEIEVQRMWSIADITNALLANWYKGAQTDVDVLQSYTAMTITGSTGIDSPTAMALGRVNGQVGFVANNVEIKSRIDGKSFSGTKITKDKLLATDYTPADFLLSFCKLFGLYFFKDPLEESSDPIRYPNGVIHICDRDTFYTDEFVNLHSYIDRGKDINIVPTVAENKWYEFGLEGIGSEAQEKYLSSYGYPYGHQLINTSMNFNNDTSQLYDGNVFKSGVMVWEKNKFFNYSSTVPAYMRYKFNYQLYSGSTSEIKTLDMTYPSTILPAVAINADGLDYYDSIPKLQVHKDDLESNDGSNVLLFFNGFNNTMTEDRQIVWYYLTDDLDEMADLNDGNPCWLFTLPTMETDALGRRIAIKRQSLPVFSTDIMAGNAITHTWNFGHPQETYIPSSYSTDGDSIYDKCWRDYIRDLYNVDTRKLTCYVRLLGKPNPSMLRKWYWFDNAVWRINAIKDWNISSLEPTIVEFVKVLDIDDYKLERITSRGRVYIIFDQTEIGYSGGVITGRVIAQNPTNAWTFADYFGATDELGNTTTFSTEDYVTPLTGVGAEVQFRMTVPANTGLTPRTFTLGGEDSSDEHFYGSFIQRADDTPVLQFTDTGYTFDLTGGQVALNFYAKNIQSNTLSVSSSSEWAMASVGNGSVTVVVHNYTGTTNRTATITLTGRDNNDNTLTTTAAVVQTSASLTISTDNLVFDYWDTTGKTVTITTSGPWTAEENEE